MFILKITVFSTRTSESHVTLEHTGPRGQQCTPPGGHEESILRFLNPHRLGRPTCEQES